MIVSIQHFLGDLQRLKNESETHVSPPTPVHTHLENIYKQHWASTYTEEGEIFFKINKFLR